MTHEYVIAVGGRVEPRGLGSDDADATAVAWAADSVLAVGPDDVVRAISRGDSTFLDVGGCVVTALPEDLRRAESVVQEATNAGARDLDLGALLVDAGLLDADSDLEPGSPADLAFWETDPSSGGPDGRESTHLVAIVRGGAFTEGDEHLGPFPAASS